MDCLNPRAAWGIYSPTVAELPELQVACGQIQGLDLLGNLGKCLVGDLLGANSAKEQHLFAK